MNKKAKFIEEVSTEQILIIIAVVLIIIIVIKLIGKFE